MKTVYLKPTSVVIKLTSEKMVATSGLTQSNNNASTSTNGNGESEYSNDLVKGDAGLDIWN